MDAVLPPPSTDPAVRFLERIVPMPVDLTSIPHELLEIYRHWIYTYMAYMDAAPDIKMWVPVGRVGPILVLGHSRPEDAEQCPIPSFPLWAFALAKISPETHERLATQLGKVLSEEEQGYCSAPPGLVQTPPHEVSNKRWLVEKLLEFPGMARDRETVTTVLAGAYANDEAFLKALPLGWREAVLSIAESYPVADLSSFIPDPNVYAMVPDSFGQAHDLVPLSLVGNTLYAASPIPPRGGGLASNVAASWKSARDAKHATVRLSLVLARAGGRAEIEQKQVTRVARTPKPGQAAGMPARSAAPKSSVKVAYTLEKKNNDKALSNPNLDEQAFLGAALYKSVVSGASDLHVEMFEGNGCLRIRKDGTLRPLDEGRFGIHRLPSTLQLLKNAINAKGGSQEAYDGKFSISVDSRFYDVRVSILPTADATETSRGYAVLRFLPKDGKVRSLHDLKLSKDEMASIEATLDKPHGLVLMTGPTGSGKTTSLNAMITHLSSTRDLKILTVEDPIEYTMDGVQQIQATEQLTFAKVLRSFLRQDPDVILVGEMRDEETARAAIVAAQTGHLVFSTLHTNGAIETIQRLRGMKIPNYDLESALLTLMSQRLLRKLCESCKTTRDINDEETALFSSREVQPPVILHEPKPGGCPHCDNGWAGRIPVLEIVKVTRGLKKGIKAGLSEDELNEICKQQGSRDLFTQSLLKAATGDTSLGEACQLNAGWD